MEPLNINCQGCKTQLTFSELRKPCPKCNMCNDLIVCPSCKYPNIYFEKEKKELPYMGAHLCCVKCKTEYQHVKCPHCTISNYWIKNKLLGYFPFQLGNLSSCYSCRSPFYLSVCPTCYQENYNLVPNSDSKSNIECSDCKYKYSFLICPFCQRPHYTQNTSKLKECRYENCKKFYYFYKCFSSTCSGFQYYAYPTAQEAEKGLGKKNFCSNCNLSYKIVFCPKCQEGLRLNLNQTETCYKEKCSSCNFEFQIYNCEACWGSSRCSCFPQEHKSDHNLCSICNQKTVTLQDKYKDYECKICYAELFEGYFEPCKHAFCCRKCAMKLIKAECPVCKTKATYIPLKIN